MDVQLPSEADDCELPYLVSSCRPSRRYIQKICGKVFFDALRVFKRRYVGTLVSSNLKKKKTGVKKNKNEKSTVLYSIGQPLRPTQFSTALGKKLRPMENLRKCLEVLIWPDQGRALENPREYSYFGEF